MTALLTLSEAACQLQVSPRTLRRLVATGALPCIRLGRLVRTNPGTEIARPSLKVGTG